MRNIISTITLIAFLALGNIQAQILLHGAGEERYEQLWNATLSVVVTGEKEFDESLKAALEEYWKVSEVEYITQSQFDKYLPDESKFFLTPIKIKHDGDPNRVNSWLSIFRGGLKSLSRYSDNSIICYAPFDHWGYEKDINDAAYRMDYMVKSMNDAYFMVREKNFKGKSAGLATRIMEVYKKRAAILKKKTIIINEELLNNENVKGKPTIKKEDLAFYDFKYEVMPMKEIEKLLESGSDKYCYFFPAIDYNKMSFVYDLETKTVVFADLDMMGLYITKKDFKEMNDIIRGDI